MAGRTYRSGYPSADPSVNPVGLVPGQRRPVGSPVRRRKDPLWAKLFVIFGALIMMGAGGVIVAGKVVLTKATGAINQDNLLGDTGVAPGKAANIDGPINMLLIGLDYRNNGQKDLVRADTIVILHIPASHDQAFLVSVPRDLNVRIPDYPKNNFKGWSTKINAAFAFGHEGGGTEEQKRARGVELLAMTLKNVIGIRFTGAAIIDFGGFEAILRELGGVRLCIDRPAESIHLTENKDGKLARAWYDEAAGKVRGIPPGYQVVRYKPGCQDLSAEKALDYSRIRKGTCCPNGDYDRQQHQQQLLKAMMSKATSAGLIADPRRALRVLDAGGKALTLDTQNVPIENFLFTLKGVTTNELAMVKTNAGKVNPIPGGDEALTPDSVAMFAALRDGKLLEFLANHPDFISTG